MRESRNPGTIADYCIVYKSPLHHLSFFSVQGWHVGRATWNIIESDSESHDMSRRDAVHDFLKFGGSRAILRRVRLDFSEIGASDLKAPDTPRKRRFRISPITDDFSVLSIARRRRESGCLACYVACSLSLPRHRHRHNQICPVHPGARRERKCRDERPNEKTVLSD